VDANNHVLNSCLADICFHLFGSSPFSLRLPNLLALVILIVATYQLSKRLKLTSAKVILTIGMLLSFHWLSFFSACRGYGLSMALLFASIVYMIRYFENYTLGDFVKCLICFQLSISSNLILIVVVLLLSAAIILNQLLRRKFFGFVNVCIWVLHFALVYYWLSFSFFLQKNGALYYGEGDSYWQVTFVSLIHLISGAEGQLSTGVSLVVFIVVMGAAFYINREYVFQFKNLLIQPRWTIVFGGIWILLCLAFYLMNHMLGVNFPEDRTGLFFYLFFVLVVSFLMDDLPTIFHRPILIGATALFALHFGLSLNFRKHSLNVYETIPERFYTTLLTAQNESTRRITIGGHRVRELFYAFFNYRHGSVLNPADAVENMQMNCDYYIGDKKVESYYTAFYDIIDTEPDWGFVLLKRKKEVQRVLHVERTDMEVDANSEEFIGLYESKDTTFKNTMPILAELNFDVVDVPVPINTWFVIQVNDSLDQTVYFKRFPLQWIGYKINGRQNLSYSLLTGNLPAKSKKIACFFWNIDKKPHSLKVNSLRISQLQGEGVDFVVGRK
jgi:hypothetical protein